MSDLAIGFQSLPLEYQGVIRLAQDRHTMTVTPLQELSGGWSGALIYLVSVSSHETKRVEHCILKLDRTNKSSQANEVTRHTIALSKSPAEFVRDHIAEIAFDQVEHDGAIAIFYRIAGQSLRNYRPLSSYRRQSQLNTIFAATTTNLLTAWNVNLAFEQAVHPQRLLEKWLSFRLKPGGNIDTFLDNTCQVPPSIPGFLINGEVFRNPLVWAREIDRWGAARPIDVITGLIHGDLNTNNILLKYADAAETIEGYYLIDFALFKEQMPLLYDQRYLEMSYLILTSAQISFAACVALIARLAEVDILDPRVAPIETAGAATVINATRNAFAAWVDEEHPSLHDDLWGQYWLAGVAVGLSYCYKGGASDELRLTGLIYAAANLKRYAALFALPMPTEVRQLYNDGQYGSAVRAGFGMGAPVRHNLPAQPTAFIGRQAELQATKDLLLREHVRLVTLTGPGGTGKTRLAIEAAAHLTEHFVDGVYFVDLAAIREVESVLTAIARTVSIRETNDRPLLDALKGQLREQQILLLLDNFEQIAAAAPLVGELLRDCPQLTLLITSREALHLRGEQIFPVPPLTLPQADLKQLSLEQLTHSEAIQLFIERAKAVKPDFELTNENAAAVAENCMRLDGLPLAIELATARMSLFSPQALLERMKSRLHLLRGGARDLPIRQQTLRDTIDWSYDLLDPNEKWLFALLSVFPHCTLEAIEIVAGGLERPNEPVVDVLDGLASLVNKSLLRRVDQDAGEPRFLMLETIREYASERLDADPKLSATARRVHASYFADLSERQWKRMAGPEREAALADLEADAENLRIAWRYWVGEKDVEQLHKLTDGLWLLYDARGWYLEMADLTTDLLKVLASTPSTPERTQQEITVQISLARILMTTKGFTPEVEAAYIRALELSQQEVEAPQLVPILRALATFYTFVGELEKGAQMGQRLLSLGEQRNDASLRVDGLMVLGFNLAFLTDLHVGLDHLERGLAYYDPDQYRSSRFRLGNNPGVAALYSSALILWLLGFPDRALKRANEAVALARRLNHAFSLASALFHAGLLHLWQREIELVEECAQAVLGIAEEHEFQVWKAVAICLQGVALAGKGRAEEGLLDTSRGLDLYQELKNPPIFWPLLLSMQARVYAHAGRPAEGVILLDEAAAILGQRSDNPLVADFWRLKGELLLALSPEKSAEAEAWFRRALEIAQVRQARMLELRAAISLSRLWREQGKAEQGRRLLSEVYGSFTEGFTTADLQEAKALLEAD